MVRWVLVFSTLCACGEPVLRNAPKPDPGVVAGAAAAVAGAATLADPKAAQANAESARPPNEKRPQKAGPSVPSDVLDRLDKKQGQGSGSATNQPQAQPQPQEAKAIPPSGDRPDTSELRPLRPGK